MCPVMLQECILHIYVHGQVYQHNHSHTTGTVQVTGLMCLSSLKCICGASNPAQAVSTPLGSIVNHGCASRRIVPRTKHWKMPCMIKSLSQSTASSNFSKLSHGLSCFKIKPWTIQSRVEPTSCTCKYACTRHALKSYGYLEL